MSTIVIRSDDINSYAPGLAEAGRALRDGALVVFPTETVYGIAANAIDPEATAKLRAAKARPDPQPFTMHIGQRSHAARFLSAPSPLVRRLVRKVWPGPLTMICEEREPGSTQFAADCPPDQLDAIYRNGTVGLRCPDHPAATRFLTEAGVPVVASSANRHGQPPPSDLRQALRDLRNVAAYAIDGGRTRHAKASTIVEVRGNTWSIRRPGAVDERTLRRLARSEILFVCTGNSCRSPMAESLFRDSLARRLDCSQEQLGEMGYYVSSAGTLGLGGGPASSGALEEMGRRGIDLAGHRSQPLTAELVHRAECIFALTGGHREAVLDLVPGAAGRVALLDPAGPVADPIGGSADDYRRCAERIERALELRLEEFLNEDRDW